MNTEKQSRGQTPSASFFVKKVWDEECGVEGAHTYIIT